MASISFCIRFGPDWASSSRKLKWLAGLQGSLRVPGAAHSHPSRLLTWYQGWTMYLRQEDTDLLSLSSYPAPAKEPSHLPHLGSPKGQRPEIPPHPHLRIRLPQDRVQSMAPLLALTSSKVVTLSRVVFSYVKWVYLPKTLIIQHCAQGQYCLI